MRQGCLSGLFIIKVPCTKGSESWFNLFKLKEFLFAYVFIILLVFFVSQYYRIQENKTKVRSFERGFERVGKINVDYSLHFFLLVLIFVLFDLEVLFFFIFIFINYLWFFLFLFVILLLMVGLIIEWKKIKIIWFI